ncbi:adenylate/guanylate cyclase domain-containing protein [Vibrio cholerae]|uniref:adenylate/guanylate cyclase domain-containing protein n=1 Tax=Vibrio cholerae TaxID=666 RepID=UPI00115AE5DE|nr:adenylate/guanylate cyclase domain-containing protein [Vibrio cholerae]TQO99637.1 adenylate/guanylate cyclase domain-containing protein [Vibrio cholerae]
MESNYKVYNHIDSFERIDEILDESDKSFDEVDEIPSRDKLTFKNGFYVYCSALFVDIRGSSQLPNKHKRPTLAKLYRSYISEVVAIVNGNPNCKEIRVDGDCVSAIYDTPSKLDINRVFQDAYSINSLIKTLNYKLTKRSITQINVGIGIDYGRALMIKSGYKGSSLNEIVWMGDVVNNASNLCNNANKGLGNLGIFVSNVFHNNLNEHNQNLLSKNWTHDCYHGDVINTAMNNWHNENCK